MIDGAKTFYILFQQKLYFKLFLLLTFTLQCQLSFFSKITCYYFTKLPCGKSKKKVKSLTVNSPLLLPQECGEVEWPTSVSHPDKYATSDYGFQSKYLLFLQKLYVEDRKMENKTVICNSIYFKGFRYKLILMS